MWYCTYRIGFIPQRRRKLMFGNLRFYLGTLFPGLVRQKGCEIVEGHLLRDYVYIRMSISLKSVVSRVVGRGLSQRQKCDITSASLYR